MEDELNCASESIEKKYYVIELKHPIRGNRKLMCLPNYWIDHVVDKDSVAISLPGHLFLPTDGSTDHDTESWKTEIVRVKLKTDSFKHVQSYLNHINKNIRSCKTKGKGTHSEGVELLASQDTAGSSPKKKTESRICSVRDFKIVEEIVINVLYHFLDSTRVGPQKVLGDASTNSVKSKIKKRMESSDDLYSRTKESEETNCSETGDIIPTLARDDDHVKTASNAGSEILTKNLSLNKRCFQTEDNIQTSANFKIVNKTKSSDYQNTQELSKPPLKITLKRAPPPNLLVSSTNKENSSTSKNDLIQSKSSPNESIGKSNKPIQFTDNDPNKAIIENNIPARLYEDFYKLRSRIEELKKQVVEQQNSLAPINFEIEKNKHEIEELKKSLRNFTNPQEAVMNAEEDTGEINRLSDSGSKTLKQNVNKQMNIRRKSTMRVEDDNNITGKTSSEKNILAQNNHNIKNNPRRTLRYCEKQKGTVELVQNSGVYVNEKNLSKILSVSKKSTILARLLMMEIFNKRALITCSVTGAKRKSKVQKPGLDKEAINILLNFVEQRARKMEWVTLETPEEKKKYRRSVMNSLRNYLHNLTPK